MGGAAGVFFAVNIIRVQVGCPGEHVIRTEWGKMLSWRFRRVGICYYEREAINIEQRGGRK